MDVLWQRAVNDLDEGNFSSLETALGGPDGFDRKIAEWFVSGKFEGHEEMLAEALSCACMLGRTEIAAYLIDQGVDPYAGMKTWLSGPHYAVSGGHLETVRMLTDKGVSLEIRNRYGGTLLGQALWSVVNENKETHAEIIELLVSSGAVIELGTAEWWENQIVPDPQTKVRIKRLLIQS